MKLAPSTRVILSVAAIVVLIIGVDWYPEHLRLFLASVAAFYVLIYVAGGGQLPWKIKVRDYLAYVLISLGVVAIVILVAVYEVHKTR